MGWAWLWIFVGGGIGAVCRAGLSALVQARVDGTFPWGVLAVNWLGCLAIGALVIAGEEHHWLTPPLRELLVMGVLGGFTTFSAFGFDTWALLGAGETGAAVANAVGSVVGGVAAVGLGAWGVRALG